MGGTTGDNSIRRRRALAILAGGLVLGVGAAITLAAWNDSEFATGTFTAGAFSLEGSLDGTAYTEHDSEAAAAPLEFTVPVEALSPGDSVEAPFAVRLDDTTTNDADVTVNLSGVTTAVGLIYSLTQTDAFGCGAGTDLVTEDALADGDDVADFALTAGAAVGTPGDPVYLCFTVTADDTLVQGQVSTATWEFAATSN